MFGVLRRKTDASCRTRQRHEQAGPDMTVANDLKSTPLRALHEELGARMVPFAGYAMPVQYPAGIIAEHNHTRQAASLFDVSHMGQVTIRPRKDDTDAAAALERLVPSRLVNLTPGRMRYTLLLNDEGGIIDDLIVTRTDAADGALFVVVNAARKDVDLAYLEKRIGADVMIARHDDRALLALQGPRAEEALTELVPQAAALAFMQWGRFVWNGSELWISRSGYTGENGFEISVPADAAEGLARTLLAHEAVAPAGLGARDSLRLEAGLCLYGHDIDETTDPVAADLVFTIAKARREAADFPGARRILEALAEGPAQRRVGLLLQGRAIAREGAEIRITESGAAVGRVTSGCYSPTLDRPIAMGYVPRGQDRPGSRLAVMVRGRPQEAEVTNLPFVPHRYKRQSR